MRGRVRSLSNTNIISKTKNRGAIDFQHARVKLNPRILLCLRVRSNEVNSKVNGIDLVGFIVWDLESELFFQCHDNFYRIQAIKAKVILEVGMWRHLQSGKRYNVTLPIKAHVYNNKSYKVK